MRHESGRTLHASRGVDLESSQRSRQGAAVPQLTDVKKPSAAPTTIPSLGSDDLKYTLDARFKPFPTLKSAASTPAKTGNGYDHNYFGGGATTPNAASAAKRQQQHAYPLSHAVADAHGATAADTRSTAAADRVAAVTCFAQRSSQAGALSPAVQALDGLRRARGASNGSGSGGGGPSARDLELRESGDLGITAAASSTAAALSRASQALRPNRRRAVVDDKSNEESEDRKRQLQRERGDHFDSLRTAEQSASALQGIRDRVSAAAVATAAAFSSMGSGGGGTAAHEKRHGRHMTPQLGGSDAGLRVRESSESSSQRPPRGVRGRVGASSAANASVRRRPSTRSDSPSSSSSDDDDDIVRQPRDRGVAWAVSGHRAPNLSGGGGGGDSATRSRYDSLGGGGNASRSSWLEHAAANIVAGGARSAGAGGGSRGMYRYPGSFSSSSSLSSSVSALCEDDTEQDGAGTAVAANLNAARCAASSQALAPRDSAGVSKLRGQLERARQSLLRLQLSSGGGALPQPPTAAVAAAATSRRSNGTGAPSLGDDGSGYVRSGAGARRGAGGSTANAISSGDGGGRNDAGGRIPDDDVTQLLCALLEGQFRSVWERNAAAATAAAAAGSSRGRQQPQGSSSRPVGCPSSSAATAHGPPREAAARDCADSDNDDDDEPARLAARPLAPGKLVRLLRALEQLHVRHPQLLQCPRHGHRLSRLLRGVAASDREASSLMQAVTGGRAVSTGGAGGGSTGGGAVAALAAAMLGGGGGSASSDGGCGGGGGSSRSAAMAAWRDASPVPTPPLVAAAVAASTPAQRQAAARFAQVWAFRL